MAAGLLVLLDDISVLMDDVATMSKVATKKTAGILGDDLAVNAEKASGFASSRELPVLWAITKGSFVNKIIILPFAFLLSAFAPWLIIPILMIGGIYLAYEGAEKIYEYFFPHEEKKHIETFEQKSNEEILSEEKAKIKSAVITDDNRHCSEQCSQRAFKRPNSCSDICIIFSDCRCVWYSCNVSAYG